MDKESIEKILTTSVTLFRPSDEKEQQIFSDHKTGRFYTIGLKSGQSFVAKFPSHDEGEDPFDLNNFSFRLRPLNNLVPHLKEVRWVFTGSYGGSGTRTMCEVTPGTPSQEMLLLEAILESHVEKSPYTNTPVYHHHEMFVKLHDVYNLLLENDHLRRALMAGQKRLQSLMLPNDGPQMNSSLLKFAERNI